MIPSILGLVVMAIGLILLRFALLGSVLPIPPAFNVGGNLHGAPAAGQPAT